MSKSITIKFCLLHLFLLSLVACSSVPTTDGTFFVRGSASSVLGLKPEKHEKITLMVPLHGRYQNQGKAVRNGFLAAYDDDRKRRNIVTQINIVDSSKGDVIELYDKATSEGSTVVVGPLTKPNVQQLAQLSRHPVPIVALNTLNSHDVNTQNFYQFGLSPIDETRAVAEKAYRSGYRNALILTPNTQRGRAAGHTLHRQWRKLGGRVTEQFTFSSNMQELTKEIRQLLRVTESSNQSNSPQHRQDFDVVLLAAPPVDARQVVSLLKYNYLEKTPIYATSSIYNPGARSRENSDLNGVYFCDVPWLSPSQLSPSLSAVHHHANNLWPESQQVYSKLYALGADAYRLAANVSNAENGATGLLSVDRNNHIRRDPVWFQIKSGKAVLMDYYVSFNRKEG